MLICLIGYKKKLLGDTVSLQITIDEDISIKLFPSYLCIALLLGVFSILLVA